MPVMSANDLLLSFNQLTAPDLPLPTAAAAARGCGFRGFGVLPATVARLGTDRVRSVLDGAGLRPTSVCAALGLTGSTSSARRERMAAAERCLEYAAELGVPLVVVVGGPDPDVTRRDAWNQVRGALEVLLDRAAQSGVRVLVEPLHPVLIDQSVATSVTDALALVDKHPPAGIVVDAWHVWWDSRLQDCLREAVGRVGIVHLSDWAAGSYEGPDRVLPGDGVADLSSICTDLLAAGFDGWWEVEIISEALWAGDQTALVRASYDAASEVLTGALARARGLGGRAEAAEPVR
jgi:sugar phosphate isomerase/epimerase